MSAAAELLDRLGRPGNVRLGNTPPGKAPRLSTGLPVLDEALDGGLPRGRICEVAAPRSTGRTGLACTIAATATAAGETIAWVDPEDTLEPESAAAAGITLERMLWVRPRDAGKALSAAEVLLDAGGFGLVVLDLGAADGRAWPRLARAAERTRSILLVLASRRQAGTFAAVGLELARGRVRWSGGRGRLVVLDGIDACIAVVRSRIGYAGRTLLLRQAGG